MAMPIGTPARTPKAARYSAARRKTPAIWRRRPPIAFMTPISAVCSAMRVFIVLAIRNTAVIRASPARTYTNVVIWWANTRPGQSPSSRVTGRSVRVPGPRFVSSQVRRRVAVASTAPGAVSSSRKARLFTPETPARARTVSLVAYRMSCFGLFHGPCRKARLRATPDTSSEATDPSAATRRRSSPASRLTATVSALPSSASTWPSAATAPLVTRTTSIDCWVKSSTPHKSRRDTTVADQRPSGVGHPPADRVDIGDGGELAAGVVVERHVAHRQREVVQVRLADFGAHGAVDQRRDGEHPDARHRQGDRGRGEDRSERVGVRGRATLCEPASCP